MPGAFLDPQSQEDPPAVTPGRELAESHRSRSVPGVPGRTPAPQPIDAAGPARSLRVLLAEDDPMVARSTVAVLRRLGHTVAHSLDGSSAWKCLQGRIHEFDALVLDVVMPRLSGSDLAHRARAAGFTGPIILVSGLVMEMDPDALALLGIRTFMTKPFLPADLDRALRGT